MNKVEMLSPASFRKQHPTHHNKEMEAAASTPAPSSLLRMAIIECVLCALFLYSDLAFVVLSGNATFEEVTSERVVALAFQRKPQTVHTQ